MSLITLENFALGCTNSFTDKIDDQLLTKFNGNQMNIVLGRDDVVNLLNGSGVKFLFSWLIDPKSSFMTF